MNFINTDKIQWEEGDVTTTSPESILGAVKYQNPPKSFTLRGVKYIFLNMTQQRLGKERDGEEWYLARRAEEGEHGMAVMVSESREGEYVQALIPRSMAGADFVA